MIKTVEIENKIDRRNFFRLAGAAGAAVGAGQLTESAAAATTHTMTDGDHAGGAEGYQFFNTDESAFIEAAIDTLIPSDSTGPGARELGVAIYIDRQMAGGYGKGDRLYLEGPFAEGTPEQGYQLPMTPSEVMRAGIADIRAHVQGKYKNLFSNLSSEERIAVMTDLDGKKVELPTVPAATFFGLLLQLTV
ncbi:MAG: gluconate 2-dehydrogenase subunit 3 family protein, partial [Aestuariivirga sp.]